MYKTLEERLYAIFNDFPYEASKYYYESLKPEFENKVKEISKNESVIIPEFYKALLEYTLNESFTSMLVFLQKSMYKLCDEVAYEFRFYDKLLEQNISELRKELGLEED